MLTQRSRDILKYGEVGKQCAVLQQYPDISPEVLQFPVRHPGNQLAVNFDRTFVGSNLAGNQAKNGGFTCAAGSHESNDRAFGYIHADAIEDGFTPAPEYQVPNSNDGPGRIQVCV